MIQQVKLAKSYQEKGFNCAQATLVGCSRFADLDLNLALKLSAMFGGGVCRRGEMCGAVSGGLMALGLKYSMTQPGDVQLKNEAYQIGSEFIAKFTLRNRSITCRELLQCDIATPPGIEYAKCNNLHDTICPGLISDAVEIFYEIIKVS